MKFDVLKIQSWELSEKYRDEVEPYLKYDVLSLSELFFTFNDSIFSNDNVNITKYITLSNMAYSLWQKTLTDLVEIPSMDKYEFIKRGTYGARCYPMQKEFKSKHYDDIINKKMTYEELLKTLDYIHFIDLDDDYKKKDTNDELSDECHITSPTELVGFIKDIYISQLSTIVEQIFTQLQTPYICTKIPSKVLFENGLTEDVSDINGLVIPALYEKQHVGNSTIQRKSESMYNSILETKKHSFLKKSYMHLKTIKDDLEYYTYLGILYISLHEELYHKIYQMPTYTWLSQEMIHGCFQSLEKNLSSKDTTYEVQLSYICDEYIEYGPIKVCGRIDALDKSSAYELKCVESLSLEHYLQIVIYAWIWNNDYESYEGPRQFKILNMKSGELHLLDSRYPLINRVMDLLFENKYADQKHLSDNEFIEKCLTTRKDVDFIYRNAYDCLICDE
jgi:hypothetical protein